MNEFMITIMGKRFFEDTAPSIAQSLKDIAYQLKHTNNLKEQDILKQVIDNSQNNEPATKRLFKKYIRGK
ncbi:hypothetical protein GCM10011351_11090 [Paraliobacillus quinghaiensis]|uniref:Uncharacterized protein n=1 Tax=Paraliobacillus quinghaiensis TaxID=470815 RepID=A0A917TN82_9BACI|nr:hypothetical protein [Paraliobacillus quinghaiensis]GGM27098.1 hypothetical protein GCM10011351_11090 [Paraliobacillus quinghaiensis]